MTFAEFANYLKLTITSERIPLKPTDPNGSFRYSVTLNWAGKAHTFEYWKGSGHVGIRVRDSQGKLTDKWKIVSGKELKGRLNNLSLNPFNPRPIPPQIEEVLYSLQIDCMSFLDAPIWEDFASNLGLNEDSIKDKKIFDECSKACYKLRRFFEHQWGEFMKCTDE